MHNVKRVITFCIVLCLVFIIPTMARANLDPPPLAFDVKIETDQTPVKAGSMKLKVSVVPRQACAEISLTEFKTENLDYRGSLSISSAVTKSNGAEFSLPIDVATSDTCGIEFLVSGGEFGQRVTAYWVFEGGAVKTYSSRPYLPRVKQYDHNDLSGMEFRHTDKYDEATTGPKHTQGYSDEEGNRITEAEYIESRKGLNHGPITQRKAKSTHEKDLQRMRELEKTPLTEHDVQIFSLEGRAWERSRGDYKFHLKEGYTKEEIGQHIKSLQEVADTTVFEVTLDLRDPKKYRAAKELIPDITPMEPSGYFKAVATGALLKKVRALGVRDAAYPNLPPDKGRDKD